MPIPCGHAERNADCYLCNLAATDPRYARIFGDESLAGSVAVVREPVGSELESILKRLGLKPSKTCGCSSRVRKMNEWGVEGCLANRAEIEAWLRSESEKVGWWAKLRAGLLGLFGGVAIRIDPVDPAPGLLDLAIERARQSSPGS